MRLAVISLPLHVNYGGILQSYALKKELESMGHEVVVIDRKVKMPFPEWWKAPFIYMKRALKSLNGGLDTPEVFREYRCRKEYPVLSRELKPFVDAEIAPLIIDSYKDIKKGDFDGFIVGSDQVWRPRYFGKIEDAFLDFARGWEVKRVSYAASFGTDDLEFGSESLRICAGLLKEFDAVSVRECSAVKICDEWLDYDGAVHVLDPVMLIDVVDYQRIAQRAECRRAKGKIMTYMLDPSTNKAAVTDLVKSWTGKDAVEFSVNPHDRKVPLEQRVVPPVENWLAGFADADFIVTDSFHATVLALIFHKPFITVGNGKRGMSRLSSLLEMFGLDQRLVHGIDPEDDGEYFLSQPDWEAVDSVLDEKRKLSRSFLADALK
jgi:hypothetical protein